MDISDDGTPLPPRQAATRGDIARTWARLQTWVRRPGRQGADAVAEAQARRCCRERIPRDALRDSGLSRDDATGIGSWQAELPFFMQSGFDAGRRDQD